MPQRKRRLATIILGYPEPENPTFSLEKRYLSYFPLGRFRLLPKSEIEGEIFGAEIEAEEAWKAASIEMCTIEGA